MGDIERNYASALFELLGKDELEKALNCLECFSISLKKEKQLKEALCSYSISKSSKDKLIDSLLNKENPKVINFLKVVSAHHRLGILGDIVKEFSSMVCESLGYTKGIVYSAIKLNEKELEDISKAFAKKLGTKVMLDNVVDVALLGGVKCYVGGRLYDGSLASRLNNLKNALNGGSL